MKDSIEMSGVVVNALSLALGQDFNRMELPERMAWILLLLRKMPDDEAVFPHGKWATIQNIEGQLDRAASDHLAEKAKVTP